MSKYFVVDSPQYYILIITGIVGNIRNFSIQQLHFSKYIALLQKSDLPRLHFTIQVHLALLNNL